MQISNNRQKEINAKHSIKAIEDLVIAIIFAGSTIEMTEKGREITFVLDNSKEQYLFAYLQRYSIEEAVYFNPTSSKWHLRQSIATERILRDWTKDGEVVALDPRLIRATTLLLWILLFARKTKRSVLIATNLPEAIRRDITYFFEIHFNTPVYIKRDDFHIKPYYRVLMRAIQMQRPASENLEYNNLLPEQEVKAFRQNMAAREEELSSNGDL